MTTYKAFYNHLTPAQGMYVHITPEPCTVLYHKGWWCINGSDYVNYTNDTLFDGMHLSEIKNEECFMWNSRIKTEKQLRRAVGRWNDEEL